MFQFVIMMIKNHLKRCITIILGIACSVAMMFCLVQMGDSIIEQYKRMASGFAYWDIRVGYLTKEQACEFDEELSEIPLEEIATGYRMEEYLGIKGINATKFVCYGGNENVFNASGYKIIDGRIPENDKQVCIEEYICVRLGAGVGDNITFISEKSGKEIVLTISGIIENTDMLKKSDLTYGSCFFSYDFMENHKELMTDGKCYVKLITIEKSRSSNQSSDVRWKCMEILALLYDVDYNSAIEKMIKGEEITEQQAEIVKYIGESIIFNNDKIQAYTELENNSVIGQALRILVLLIAVAIALLIFNSMHLAIAENTRELGILRCIGMDCRQTGLLVFAENAFYCLSGYIIGISCGNLINSIFAKKVMLLLTGNTIVLRQLLGTYMYIAIVVVLSLGLAFLLSLQKIIKLTPLEASKYTGLAEKKVYKGKIMDKWSAEEFAGRNIRRERGKSAVVIITMTFSMIILMLIVNTMLSVKIPEKDKKSKFSDYEVYITLQGLLDSCEGEKVNEITPENINMIAEIHGVDKVYAMRLALNKECSLVSNDGFFINYKVYNDEMLEWFLKENGEEELWNTGIESICIITGAYDEEDKKILEEIQNKGTIEYVLEDEKKGSMSVNAVIHTDYEPKQKDLKNNSFLLILSEKCAREIFNQIGYTDVMIKFNTDADTETKTAIADIFKDNPYVLCGSYEIGMERIIQEIMYLIYIAALLVIATMVTAVLNMIIIMKANLMLRRKEYGIWRAIGMPISKLKNTIRIEILLMLLISYVAAIILSLPMQIYMCFIMENINVTGMICGYFGVGIVVVLLVYILVMASLKFKKTNPIIIDIREE